MPEQQDVEHSIRGIRELRNRENKQRGRAGHSMHQTDEQRAPPETMLMHVCTFLVWDCFIHVTVDMDVFRAIAMSMQMKMHAVAPYPP